MSQTAAIFHEAYRGLRARKMFWIVLGISGFVVAGFACMGVDDGGVSFLVWDIGHFPGLEAEVFYKSVFLSWGVGFWLTWVAVILALISTAGIFPQLMRKGTIDLVVARPISRTRLFLTEYAAGLLFVALQVGVFSLASFLVMGIRGGAWEPGLFLAVPLVVLFYSYLFSVCVLLGTLTRSTVAALLLTLLFWALVAVLHFADVGLLTQQYMFEREAAQMRAEADRMAEREARAEEGAPATTMSGSYWGDDPDELSRRADDTEHTAEVMGSVQEGVYLAKSFLPKTAETVDLLERALIRTADLPDADGRGSPGGEDEDGAYENPGLRAELKLRDRSPAWIIGTSLAFEAVMLALAAFVFYRRDF